MLLKILFLNGPKNVSQHFAFSNMLPSTFFTYYAILPTSFESKGAHLSDNWLHSLLAGVSQGFLNCKVNARGFVPKPRVLSYFTLSITDRYD